MPGCMPQRTQPEIVAAEPKSFTGQYLKPLLERASVKPVVVETKPKKPTRSPRASSRGAKSRDVEEPDLIAAK